MKIVWIVVVSLFLCLNSYAARFGTVDSDETPVYENPSSHSKVIEKIKKGTSVTASNLPIEGFHKVRLESGTIGWIEINSLKLDSSPTPEELIKAGAPRPDDSSENDEPQSIDPLKPRPRKPLNTKKKWRVRLLGGMDFFSLGGMVQNFGNLGQGYYYGGEVSIAALPWLGILFRVEKLFNSTVLTDKTNNVIYQINSSGMPITVGPDFGFLGNTFSFHLALLVGASVPTSVSSSIAAGTGVGSSTTVNSNHLTTLIRAQMNWQLSRLFSLFLESGYRYSISPVVFPDTTSGTAGAVFQSSFPINMSGPIVGLGVCLGFE